MRIGYLQGQVLPGPSTTAGLLPGSPSGRGLEGTGVGRRVQGSRRGRHDPGGSSRRTPITSGCECPSPSGHRAPLTSGCKRASACDTSGKEGGASLRGLPLRRHLGRDQQRPSGFSTGRTTRPFAPPDPSGIPPLSGSCSYAMIAQAEPPRARFPTRSSCPKIARSPQDSIPFSSAGRLARGREETSNTTI